MKWQFFGLIFSFILKKNKIREIEKSLYLRQLTKYINFKNTNYLL